MPKLLTLGQILWHYTGRAFQELSHVCFGFILAIIGIALDRSEWRSVISPKMSIFFKFDPIWPLKYWPKVTKIAHHKVHWHVFSLTKFGDSSSYRSWDIREGQNLPPLSRARDSQTRFPVRVLRKFGSLDRWDSVVVDCCWLCNSLLQCYREYCARADPGGGGGNRAMPSRRLKEGPNYVLAPTPRRQWKERIKKKNVFHIFLK